ncbi:MAG: sigma-70 family RNA polymerase sigma factor [Vampirovibrionales bacterium]|nr:sigma-70 family RNA polymerase sigma factor [Vampirovibrionales bacterium]
MSRVISSARSAKTEPQKPSPAEKLQAVQAVERQGVLPEATLDALVLEYLSLKRADAKRNKLRHQVVQLCLPYVKRLAKSLARRADDPVEDLIQVGTIGLLKALDKFNPLAGTRFKTYATYFINGEIRHYLRDQMGMIKPPRQIYELYYRMNQIIERLTRHYGRTPTDLEIASELECPVTEVLEAKAMDGRKQIISLDQFQIGQQGEESVYIERLVDDRQGETSLNHENRLMLDKALDSLKPELRVVIQQTFFEDKTQTEIADALGISQMQVSRRLKKALQLLAEQF